LSCSSSSGSISRSVRARASERSSAIAALELPVTSVAMDKPYRVAAGSHQLGCAPMDLRGAGALVAGGASGLGAATARTLAAAGAGVVIADLDSERGEALAAEIGARFAATDVTDPSAVEAAVELAAEAERGLRVSVCCAGIGWAERLAR